MKIISYQEAQKIVELAKQQKLKTIFKTGCFDILHYGHIYSLQEAKKYADILIVGLGTDNTLRQLKGSDHPFFTQEVRAKVLAALECVDYIVILEEELIGTIDHSQLLFLMRPDIFYLSATDRSLKKKIQIANELNIEVKIQEKEIEKMKFASTAISKKIMEFGC